MKRIVLLALLALALPLAAFANSDEIDFSLQNGTLSGSSTGLSLSGSEFSMVDGLNGLGVISGNLGSVTLTTGGLTSGSLTCSSGTCGTFGNGTFVITGNGSSGLPSGVLFSGTLTHLTWTADKTTKGYLYILTGDLSGTWYNGTGGNGGIVLVVKPLPTGGYTVLYGTGFTTTVPEPGTLGLMGTGLIGVAGLLRRKLRA
jgi:hypothetical protein